MKKFVVFSLITIGLILVAFATYALLQNQQSVSFVSPLTSLQKKANPFSDYTFDTLSQTQFEASPIDIIGVIDKADSYSSYQFAFTANAKRITGQVNLPNNYQAKQNPAIIMIRGFVDPSIYQTGIGTKNAAAVFAQNDYITFAPDFAGYGESDPPEEDTFLARFQKPATVLTLIESVKALEYIDPNNIFLWGHSNGGQIAISVLEISGLPLPTTLWAPVTKPFPYSILYYTDEFDDYGQALRKALATFESKNDANLFSTHTYLHQLNAPIQLHQGGADDAIPLEWSNQFVAQIQDIKTSTSSGQLDITYYTYPSADHNLRPNWNTVVQRDLTFFQSHLK